MFCLSHCSFFLVCFYFLLTCLRYTVIANIFISIHLWRAYKTSQSQASSFCVWELSSLGLFPLPSLVPKWLREPLRYVSTHRFPWTHIFSFRQRHTKMISSPRSHQAYSLTCTYQQTTAHITPSETMFSVVTHSVVSSVESRFYASRRKSIWR